MFVLNSEVTIGGFRFTGVNDVLITRGIHSIAETAVIKLPAVAKIVKGGRTNAEPVITAGQFKEGDEVTVKLGYNGDLRTEFRGFVKQSRLNMPLEVVCEGCSWLLRRNKPKVAGKGKLKDLLLSAVGGVRGGYKLRVECDADIEMEGLLPEGKCGFDIIELIRKATDNNLVYFFREPDVLWCGLLYSMLAKGSTPSEVVATYRLGYNCLSENTLVPASNDNSISEVVYIKVRDKNHGPLQVSTVIGNSGVVHKVTLNNIRNESSLRLLADEKANTKRQKGFEGKITAFLQPYAEPGGCVTIKRAVHEKMNGTYLVESVETHFGINGARRTVELGAMSGSDK